VVCRTRWGPQSRQQNTRCQIRLASPTEVDTGKQAMWGRKERVKRREDFEGKEKKRAILGWVTGGEGGNSVLWGGGGIKKAELV